MHGGLADLLAEAGLTGRGGAGFSTATKIAAAQRHRADLDRQRLRRRARHRQGRLGRGPPPARAGRRSPAGGRTPRRPHPLTPPTAAARPPTGCVPPASTSWRCPAHYVSSEETSLISAARGGLARPMTKRAPFVTGGTDSRGRRVRPTLVLNAETTWRIAQVAEPRRRLVPLLRHRRRARPAAGLDPRARRPPGCARDRRRGAARSPRWPPRAWTTRPPPGCWSAGSPASSSPARRPRPRPGRAAGLAPYGGSLGSGVLEVLDPATCPAVDARRAGRPGGRGVGGPVRAVHVRAAEPGLRPGGARGPARPGAAASRARAAGPAPGRGACHHPDGTARLAASGLRVHAAHLDLHAQGRCGLRPAPGGTP